MTPPPRLLTSPAPVRTIVYKTHKMAATHLTAPGRIRGRDQYFNRIRVRRTRQRNRYCFPNTQIHTFDTTVSSYDPAGVSVRTKYRFPYRYRVLLSVGDNIRQGPRPITDENLRTLSGPIAYLYFRYFFMFIFSRIA